MKGIIKIAVFLCVNAIGFVGIAILFHILQMLGYFAETSTSQDIDRFFQTGMLFWGCGAIISIGFLTAQTGLKYLLLLAPILTISLYGLRFLV